MKDAKPGESQSMALYLLIMKRNRNDKMHEVSSSQEKEANGLFTLQTGKSNVKENWLCASNDVQSTTAIPSASLFKSRQKRPDGETEMIFPYSDRV